MDLRRPPHIGDSQRAFAAQALRFGARPLSAIDAGLCDTCKHQKLVSNTRGSVFSMCLRSKTDPRYPKYPRLPVRECRGYVSAPR